ncbi:MAG: ImmA/IrrE family metallo-endopeptidase [Clostridia bacterium]|nr:ImmA/IrrE family metallo-endopeptidase [Clostridia bacterium]
MKKYYDFLDYSPEEKLLRLSIREKADEIRISWAKKGLFDVFDILENECILIRKPLETTEFSGFTTYIEGCFIVFLNSTYTVGHERFSGAHELGHLVMHREKLLKESLLSTETVIEQEATMFAVEFLMPTAGVEEIFHKIVGVEPNQVNVKHVIRMHHYFKVSYKAMLKRLIYLRLCDVNLFDSLCDYCSLENAELLQDLTRKEGYNCDLIKKSNTQYVSKEYEEIIRRNYETGKISYKRLEFLLGFIGRDPIDYGYEVSDGEN